MIDTSDTTPDADETEEREPYCADCLVDLPSSAQPILNGQRYCRACSGGDRPDPFDLRSEP